MLLTQVQNYSLTHFIMQSLFVESVNSKYQMYIQIHQGVKITKLNSEYFVPSFSSNFKIKEDFTKKS